MSSSDSKQSRTRSARLWWTPFKVILAVLPILALAATYLISTFDIQANEGKVLRGIHLGQTNVGGMTPQQLDIELDRLSSYVEIAPVYIRTGDAAYQIDAERLGLTLDRDQIRAEVFSAGRHESGLTRPYSWVKRLFKPVVIHPDVRLDPAAAEAGLAAVSRTISIKPGKPTMTLRTGRLELEPGTPGSILDVERLMTDLSASLPDEPGQEIVVDAYTTAGPLVDIEIQNLVDRLNVATQTPITLKHGLKSDDIASEFTVPSAIFRSWLSLDLDKEPPLVSINSKALFDWVNEEAGVANAYINTRELTLKGDRLVAPETNAWQCCSGESAQHVLDTVLSGSSTVEITMLTDDTDPLVRLGVKELVGEFTTEYEPGKDRVINIERMADIVRGAVIESGSTFSLNGYVGQRSERNGFVEAGVIYDGVFTTDVGGGVSQFATTLFNAAFFAGLDIPTYQAHSIYIERYPYGREATVSWPLVDLRIKNPTPYPVLLWTEYEEGSVTVKLFGTKVVEVTQGDQEVEEQDQCTSVVTQRRKEYLDGTVRVDKFRALYQPREGIGCDGQPTKKAPECAEGEVLVDNDGNGLGDTCVATEQACPQGTQAVDTTGDGVTDACSADNCPANTTALDTTGDGVADTCQPMSD